MWSASWAFGSQGLHRAQHGWGPQRLMPLKLNPFSKALSFFLFPLQISVLFPVMTHGRCVEECGMPVSA